MNIIVREKGLDIREYSFHFDDKPQVQIDLHPAGDVLYLSAWREYGFTGGIDEGSKIFEEMRGEYWKINQVYRISVARDGSRVRMYINQDKVLDLENALPAGENYTLILSNNLNENGMYISNVRIATGVSEPTAEFKENLPFVTQNILFDVNSDRIKPASYQILRQIAQAIKDTEGTILIIGHTDSDGDPDRNLDLSKRRAASVKHTLVKEFGIQAVRLETEGKGQTEPIATNDTPEGKTNNRRVEFNVLM